MKKLTILALAAVSLIALNGQAEAQRRGAGQGMRQGVQQGAGMMMVGAAFSPAMLLRQEQALELTDDQIATLTELRDGLEAADRETRDAREAHQARMQELMGSDSPDIDAIRNEFATGHAAMGDYQWTRMEAGLRARAVLTDEQRGQVRGMMSAGARMRQGAGMRGSRGQRGRAMNRARRVRP